MGACGARLSMMLFYKTYSTVQYVHVYCIHSLGTKLLSFANFTFLKCTELLDYDIHFLDVSLPPLVGENHTTI